MALVCIFDLSLLELQIASDINAVPCYQARYWYLPVKGKRSMPFIYLFTFIFISILLAC